MPFEEKSACPRQKLYCINKTYTQINKLKCRSNFATMYQKEKNMIEEIIRLRKKIMNSGIRTV